MSASSLLLPEIGTVSDIFRKLTNYNVNVDGYIGTDYDDLRRICALSAVFIIYLIYVPIVVYGIYQYNKYRHCIFMTKRYQSITVCFRCVCTFSFSFLST